ncbi:MAG: succinate dehydrogenase assembly factor 2 [Emcibacter sp.]|nr:succinate dehydrogenase assembly factor 2 [Emcibacter sp.]
MPSFDSPGFIEPEIDTSEPLDIRRKRLKFRSWHRGIKEADILLGSFADDHLKDMSPAQLDCYENLLREPDLKIVTWITKDQPAPEYLQNDVMDMLQALDYLKMIK